jgi:toluene monooxygenase system protein E
MSEELKPLKTWSHLAGARKRPSEYEIVSVNTLYSNDPQRPPLELSVDLAMNRWYQKHRSESRLQHPDWNAFRDPDAAIYRTYTLQQDKAETYVDGLLSQYNERGHDGKLSPAWVTTLAALYTPARYLCHAAQMLSAYSVTVAPASTIANCAIFCMADQFRWVSRVAYRTAELAKSWPDAGFARDERRQWEQSIAWRGYRELVEKLLTTYDWGESVIALHLVAMPAIESGLQQLGLAAQDHADDLTAFLLDAQARDAARRVRWIQAFMTFVLEQPGNRAPIAEWVAKWSPLGEKAVSAYCNALPKGAERADAAAKALRAFHQSLLR